MAESIAKKYKSKKKVIWTLTVSLLLISVFVFSTNAFSLDGAKRFIVFNDEKWDMESIDQPEWMTNKDSITFKVDLKEDYENISQAEGVTELERPFAVKADYSRQYNHNCKNRRNNKSRVGLFRRIFGHDSITAG